MKNRDEVPDALEKKIVLRAAPQRVWQAISDAKQFGAWFGVELDAPFVAGKRVTGKLRPTTVDAAVAKLQEPHTGKRFEITVDRVEPQSVFSFFWHPYVVDEKNDYGRDSMTRVTFELSAAEGGTLLKVTESGFSKVPLERRADAFHANEDGWQHQTQLIAKYLAAHG